MTAKEVLERIDEVLSSDYHYDKTLGYQLTSDDFEWLEIAKQVLEKQIPKNPIEETINFDYNTKSQMCPSCGNPLIHYGNPHDSYDDDFCRKCGQAIDWGDEDE